MQDSERELRVGMVGHGFMAAAHSQAWRTAPRFFQLPFAPVMQVLAGRDEERVRASAARLGWAEATTDWRDLIARDDIDLIDIVTPGDSHAEIAIAALEAGKHVMCEKPLANNKEEAERMAAVARTAAASAVYAMCGFTYRRTPALSLAKQLVVEGAVGTIRHVRAQYLQDWLSDENAPMTWRLKKERSGSGALGDLGAHIVDAAQWIAGDRIADVSARLQTFVPERQVSGSFVGLGGHGDLTDAQRDTVTVDDAAIFTARFAGGALGVFEATRNALGRKNALRLEVNGTTGSLAFDFEDMNTLWVYDASDGANAGFRRIVATEPQHPYIASWWPAGHGLGYEHAFTHQVVDFLQSVADRRQPEPSFDSAAQVQRVLTAVESSAAAGSCTTTV